MMGKIRPQIFMALFMLSLITGYVIFQHPGYHKCIDVRLSPSRKVIRVPTPLVLDSP